MKKLIVIAIVLFAASTGVKAQTEKGTILLGGGLSFQTSDGNSVFTMSPNIGYFFMRNVAVGGQFLLFATDGNTSWAIGPFIRGYFAGSDKGKFFAQGGFNVGGATGSDTKFGFGVGAGYAIFLNQSIALEMGLGYTKTGDSDGIFGINIGFQIHYKR